jgi:hypothetical protein
LITLVTLADVIGGPIGSIAATVPVFKPIADTLKKMTVDILKDAPAGDVKADPAKRKEPLAQDIGFFRLISLRTPIARGNAEDFRKAPAQQVRSQIQ